MSGPQSLGLGARGSLSARRALILLTALTAGLLIFASGAQAFLYWTSGDNSIGRASLDGSAVQQSFIGGVSAPCGLTVDGAHVYWANPGTQSIGRANLDGSGANPNFITGTRGCGVAVDGAHVYWSNLNTSSIGRANLDGSGVDQKFIPVAANACGLAVDAAHIYWANLTSGTIGRANLSGTGVNQNFITGASGPCGVAVDAAHIYWDNAGNTSGSIGRANLDGSGVNQNFIGGARAPCGVAVDSAHIYWANDNGTGNGSSIGRANLDGSGVNQSLIGGLVAPCGPAVDSTAAGPVFRLQGIEVTQSVQDTDLPTLLGRTADYRGVGLAENGKTIVRVYANLAAGSTAPLQGIPAVLLGYRASAFADGFGPVGPLKALPGGPLFPQSTSPPLTLGGEAVTAAERASPTAAYTFVLPPAWTRGVVDLTAVVNPGDLDSVGALQGCYSTCFSQPNVETLGQVAFTPTRSVRIDPVALVTSLDAMKHGVPPFGSPSKVFAAAGGVLPVGSGQLIVPPRYAAFINVNGIVNSGVPDLQKNEDALSLLSAFDSNLPAGDVTIGANDAGTPLDPQPLYGIEDGTNINCGLLGCLFHHRPVAVVNTTRPLTSVAHELGHALGLPHAGSQCGGTGDVPWPPDNRGYIHGVGIDRDSQPPSAIKYPGLAPDPGPFGNHEYYDYMAYCTQADENITWVSTDNWNTLLNTLSTGSPGQTRALRGSPGIIRQRAVAPPTALHVVAYQGGGSTQIATVTRAQSNINVAGSPYQLIARDSSGKVISDTGMAASTGYAESGAASTSFIGDANPAAASVAVVHDGQVLVARARSPHPPRVHLLAPRGGSRIGGRRRISIRWRASDPDGGALLSRIDYSINNGHSWRTAYLGPNANQAKLPGSAIPRSTRARIRVVVNDGFNDTTAVSRRLVSHGAPPAVAITSPAPRTQVRRDSDLYLSGSAFDDRLHELAGRNLSWYAGPKLLGHGATLTASALPAGRRRIRLVARDRFGRRGSASAAVRIIAVKPTFVSLRAPAHLSQRARRLRLVVAASLPSALLIRGRHIRPARVTVGRASKKISIAVVPGAGPLDLHLRLTSGGKAARQSLQVSRGKG